MQAWLEGTKEAAKEKGVNFTSSAFPAPVCVARGWQKSSQHHAILTDDSSPESLLETRGY